MNAIFRFLSSTYGLFVHFAFLVFVIALILYRPIILFTNLDSVPENIVTPKNESRDIRSGEHPVPEVEVGFALENFAEFDILHNRFIAEGIVWFLFDKSISLTSLEKFSINKGSILEKSPVIVTHIGDRNLARFHVRFSFTTTLLYRNFPLDDHRIIIEIKNDTLTDRDVKFVSSKKNFSPSPDIEKEGWTLVNHDVSAGYAKTVLQPDNEKQILYIPHVIFSLDFDRSGLHLVVIILLPLLLLFFAALAVFLVRIPSSFDASSTFMGSVFALVGYLFVAETISPQVGYMMLSNFIYLSVLVCTFIVAMLGWNANSFTREERGFVGTSVELLLVGLLYYFIVLWRG